MYEFKVITNCSEKLFEEELAKAVNKEGYKLRDFKALDKEGWIHYVALLYKCSEEW